MGRSATLDLALSRAKVTALDPRYRFNSGPIVALASALWDNWVPRKWVLRAWNCAFGEVNANGFTWREVTDGLTAAAATCSRIGWKSDDPGRLRTGEGISINLDAMCPQSVLLLCNRAIEMYLLGKSAKRDDELRGMGPQAVPWILLKRLVDTKPTSNWTPLHQSKIRCCVSGGQWPAERLHGAGLSDSPECYLCGSLRNQFHRGYTCPGGHDFRYNYGLLEGTVSAAKSDRDNPL